jgi:hypothetical protein
MNCRKNDHYYTHILIITKRLTIMKTQQNAEFMHNSIMLTLKIILELIPAESYLKNC